MASTYTTNLGIEKIATGEKAGTWGDTTNTNFDLIDEAIDGVATVTLTGTGTSGSPNTETINEGASSSFRHNFITVTSGSDLGGTCFIKLAPDDAQKLVFIKNSLAGSQSLTLSQGTGSTTLTIANGKTVLAKFGGEGGSSCTVVNALGDFVATSLTGNLTGNVTGNVTGAVTGNADTATEATNVTVSANNTTDETVYLTFVDGATGTQGIETDTGLSYNPSSNVLTAGSLTGNVTGAVTGNASTATALATGRNFSLTGDVTASAVSFDGTGNVALSTTIAANSVALGTDTTGNYIAAVSGGTGVSVSGSGEGATATVSIGQAVATSSDVQFDSFGVGTAASSTTGEIRATNNITAFYSSDERLKEDVTYIDDALHKVNSINGVEFNWTAEYMERYGGEDGFFIRKHDVGLIAQDVEKVLPEVVAERDDGYKALKYDRIVALLVNSIHELTKRVEELETRMEE